MKRLVWISFALVVALTGCKGKEVSTEQGGAPAQAAKPTPAPTPTAASGGAAAAKPGGTFASPYDYCVHRRTTFVADDCDQPGEGELCFCEPATAEILSGTLDGTTAGGVVLAATLVVTADHKADYAHCELAIQTAAGWHIVPEAFPCDAAPISHDGGVAATIDRYEVTRAGTDDELRIAWTEVTFGGDVVRTKHELTCKVPAAGAPTCAPKRAVP